MKRRKNHQSLRMMKTKMKVVIRVMMMVLKDQDLKVEKMQMIKMMMTMMKS